MYKSDSIFVRNKSVKCTEEFKSCVSQFYFVKSFQKMLAEHLLEKNPLFAGFITQQSLVGDTMSS